MFNGTEGGFDEAVVLLSSRTPIGAYPCWCELRLVVDVKVDMAEFEVDK